MFLFLFLIAPAFAETRDLNQHNSGWTELPHSGGDITIEDARPKPSVTPQAAASAQPELVEGLEGLSPEDRDLFKAQQDRLKAAAKFNAMNAQNPVSDQFQVSSLRDKVAKQLGFSPDSVAKASNSKALARVAAFVTSPETTSDWQKILETPIRSPWIAVELGWVILFFVLRSWRLSKAKGLARRLFENAWLYCAFLLGLLLGIPWLVYGQPYVRLLSGVASALFS